MSQVYATEPQTSGRVIFETTHGPLEIQLWSRECHATTRFFLQLCLDGFYEGMLFHRIVPNFLIQTGALRQNDVAQNKKNNLNSSEELKMFGKYRYKHNANDALDRRRYELNSRIRFNHRGQVAMAFGIDDDQDEESQLLQPQFFITLEEAPYLDGKHVVFGTISGPTVFNALRIGRTDVDESTHQPTIMEDAPRIERVKIMDNPIHTDIVPTSNISDIPWKNTTDHLSSSKDKPTKKKKKRKGIKNLNVLSFGGEEEEELPTAGGMKSSHDVIQSKTLSKNVDKKVQHVVVKSSDDVKQQDQSTGRTIENDRKKSETTTNQVQSEPTVLKDGDKESKRKDSSDGNSKGSVESTTILQGKNIKQESSSGEENADSLPTSKDRPRQKDHKQQKTKSHRSFVEERRAKYAKKGLMSKNKRKREEDTMLKLMAFQSKIVNKVSERKRKKEDEEHNSLSSRLARQSGRNSRNEQSEESRVAGDPAYSGQVLDNDDEEELRGGDWLKTRFTCRKHMDHDARLGGDGRSAMDDYEVVDDKHRNSSTKKRHSSKNNHRSHHHRPRHASHKR